MKKKEADLVNKPLFTGMIKYTLPIIAAHMLSNLFHVADLIVVGRFCGTKAVAAVGAAATLITLTIVSFYGFANGTGVIVAFNYGAKNNEKLEKAVHTALPLAVLIGAAVTVFGVLGAERMLSLMGTPADIIDNSALYLKIYFSGTVLRMVYSFCIAIFRSSGDSKTPLVYLTAGGVLNVALNILFVTVCDMTVDGVALGTVLSEAFTCFLCVRALARRNDALKFSFSKIKSRFDKATLGKIVRLGVPAAIQSSMFSIANVLIQTGVNSFGSAVVAGNSAAYDLGLFAYYAAAAYLTSASAFMGQNLGAGRFDRIKKLPLVCIFWATAGGLTLGAITRLLGPRLLGLYNITAGSVEMETGLLRLTVITLFIFVDGYMEIYEGLLGGLGKAKQSMIITVFTVCVVRVAFLFTLFRLPAFHTVRWLYLLFPITWVLTIAISAAYYYRALSAHKKQRTKAGDSELF